jgi:voltage-gated potassium channel
MIQYKRSVFLVLLISLLLLLVVQPLVVGMPRSTVFFSLLSSILQVAAIFVLAEDRRLRVFAWLFGLPALFAIWGRHYVPAEHLEPAIVIAHALTSVFLAATAILILRYVMTHDITADSVVAAVCAYLLIGIVVGHLCFIVETLDPGAYRVADNLTANMEDPDSRSALLTYYSFTTLTTTGYGDIVPNRPLSRTMAWMEAATGQLYLTILIAGVVSMRVSQKLTRSPVSRSH